MAGRANRTAQQRFVTRSRARAARRTRIVRLASVGLLTIGLASCVADQVRPVGASLTRIAPTQAAPERPVDVAALGIPVIATTPASEFVADAPTGPSFLATVGQTDRMRATLCLASAIYYEAATEPDEGQRAVAQVVLNRVRHREWPSTVCGVVYQGSDRPGCQFSYACDGAMARGPSLSAWIRARRVAERALNGDIYAPVGSATFYHTLQVSPAWGKRMTPVAVVGAHIFYRLPGDDPSASALPFAYAGREPTPGPLPRVAPPAQLLAVVAPTTVPYVSVEVAPPAPVPSAAALRSARPGPPPSRDARYVNNALPDSEVRPEWRESGTWIAPAR
jgi:Cell Wall Hydrolase